MKPSSVFGPFHSSKVTILLEGINALYGSFVKCLANLLTKKVKIIVSSMHTKNMYLAGK
jgi:hypothetical protein